ncbi:MAG: protein-L-isoaspartate O-methyltransferase [Gammaproteobacteria bacterium SG8_31]|jgi:protein-L-isoaspartate(D-aspartate) O-methyltransferase|nr:MAG: protein-L-isoaspartate O-methyltransferase [Gammaproteobacteria bacterium SG8_31]
MRPTKALRRCVPAMCVAAAILSAVAMAADNIQERRQALVNEIASDVRMTAEYLGRDRLDSRVLEAIGRVPRHELVPREQRRYAYENRPLPIGYGQTISQPYIVAIMTELIDPQASHVVLEVGTGSGYQAAVLAELVRAVCTIEIIPELAERARRDLERLGYRNIRTREGDGYYGWSQCGPFDGIVVTAGASHVPPPLIQQLRPGGKLIIPVGSRFLTQQLLLVEKSMDGEVTTRQILPVRFVPLTGGH